MNNSIIVLIIGFFLVSCSNEEIIPDTDSCLIKEYGHVFIISSSETHYKHKLLYAGEKIMKRINYDYVAPAAGIYNLGEVSRDSLVYDNYERLWKIYQVPLSKNYSYSEFEYNKSNVLPYKRNEIFIFNYTNSTYTYTYPEEIFYDSKGRIIRTVLDYTEPNYEFNTTTIYEYDSNGNLLKIDSTKEQYGITNQIISEYSDYDDKKNPFSSFPFLDSRGISSSINNFRHYEIITYTNKDITGTQIGTYNYEYNDFDYPLLGTYDCD